MNLDLKKQTYSKNVKNKETTKEKTCRKGKNSGKGAGEERRRLKDISSKNMRIFYNKHYKKKSKNQISDTVDLRAGGITNSKREQRRESER